MGKFVMTRRADLAITAIALTALMTEPAWALDVDAVPVPATGAGILAVGAIIGTLVIAKWWRRD